MTAIKGITALLLATLASPAAADTVYKYQRPDGKVIYSDSPVEGAKLIGRFELVPAPASPAVPRREAPRRPATSSDDAAEQRAEALDAADARIKAADLELKNALERQQRAVEPRPGERRGNEGGATSRLTPEYFARQRAAAAAVDGAREELDAAYRARNEARE